MTEKAMNARRKRPAGIRIAALAILFAFGAMAAPDIAQARRVKQSTQSGTEAQRRACTPDVWRLCSAYVPFEGPITACLIKNNRLGKLSRACHQVFRG